MILSFANKFINKSELVKDLEIFKTSLELLYKIYN